MDTKLSNNLDIKTALTKIYGVNTFLSVKICKKLGFALNFKVQKMHPFATIYAYTSSLRTDSYSKRDFCRGIVCIRVAYWYM